MGPALTVLAWIFSVGPLCIAAALEVGPAGGLGHTALVLLPWIALVGLPRRGPPTSRKRGIPWIALFLPPLALAAHLDLAGGASIDRLAGALVGGTGTIALLSLAARRAALGRWVHPVAWLVLIVCPPLITRSMALGGGAPLRPILERVAGASPLEVALRLAGGRAIGAVDLVLVAASSLMLLVLTEVDLRRGRGA